MDVGNRRRKFDLMMDLFKLILGVMASLFKSRASLEAEILILRQQINVLRRRARNDRTSIIPIGFCLFGYHLFPSVLSAVAIVRQESIIRWRRAGFRAYWCWRSRNHVGRPKISAELRTLIGEMSRATPLWGAPHIHGELLKLGFEVAQSTVVGICAATAARHVGQFGEHRRCNAGAGCSTCIEVHLLLRSAVARHWTLRMRRRSSPGSRP